ncbi:phage tail protein [Pseudomonas sp. I2]|uniref:phage tail protein n=1 Tax=Pseudomonas sp. I2 TaxID=1338438 RepID=UPI0034D506D6
MAIETFIWVPDDEVSTDSTLRVRRSRFGDGYAQVSGDGLNAEDETHSLTFGGLKEELQPILSFIRAHGGYRSFLWTTPAGVLGLYRCSTFREQWRPGGIGVLSMTFERAYHP